MSIVWLGSSFLRLVFCLGMRWWAVNTSIGRSHNSHCIISSMLVDGRIASFNLASFRAIGFEKVIPPPLLFIPVISGRVRRYEISQ